MNTPDTTPNDTLARLNEAMFAAGRDGSHDHLMDVLHDAALDHLLQCCGELGVSELRKLEDENARLWRIVADLTLSKQILQEVVKKKL